MLYDRLKGTGVAMITPFNSSLNVDFEALRKLTNHLIDGGVDYLVVLGTTAESATLNKEEKKEVVDCVKEANAGRLPIVMGIGGNNTAEVMETIKQTDFNEIDAILSVSPYYNKPTQSGIFGHYEAIVSVAPKPVILYNVPSRTASNISPDTTISLAGDFDNIIGIKEAAPDIVQSMKLIQQKPANFLVISGDDALTFPMLACGGSGVISVVANVYPKAFSNMVRFAMEGKLNEARKIHYALLDFIDLLFKEGNPAGAKAALSILGICDEHIRLPLVKMTPGTRDTMEGLMKEINL